MEATDENLENDIALIRKIGMGDRPSFEMFYQRYSNLVYSTAFRVLNNASDAEDVTQDVMFMIWEKSPMYDPARGKPITWAVTMTRNKAIDRLRSVQRRFRLQDEVEREANPQDFVQERRPVDELDAMEKGNIVRTAVMKLSREQREVIEMAYFGGLTQQEIAARLDEPLGTVKARIRRGMLRLKKMVGPAL
ncbi:MAG: sigma-70 family RNA polymerase sigma factor [Terrimicrobiaceae bacterium]|nr:sigma-70 family RNA polymerase sigma factor [Terrimicrobiaceae bacterium]